MLEYRIKTFLTVCEHMSFTKASLALNLTQPAISQHIRALEEHYGKKLFTLVGRQIKLTTDGEELRRFSHSMEVDIKKFHKSYTQENSREQISFGATLSIGEFTLPPIITSLMKQHPHWNVQMRVNNTLNLLSMIDKGEIDFAFIEGAFNKAIYSYRLFSLERFIAIGSRAMKEKYPHHSLEDLKGERILIREEGSGTRAVFTHILKEKGLSLESFHHVDEIGNLNVIKRLVSENLGISFMYEAAAKEAIKENLVFEIPLTDVSVKREFNFVYSLNSHEQEKYEKFLALCKSILIKK